MQRCKGFEKYKANEPPKCNNGKGCQACKDKWQARNIATMRYRYRVQQSSR